MNSYDFVVVFIVNIPKHSVNCSSVSALKARKAAHDNAPHSLNVYMHGPCIHSSLHKLRRLASQSVV